MSRLHTHTHHCGEGSPHNDTPLVKCGEGLTVSLQYKLYETLLQIAIQHQETFSAKIIPLYKSKRMMIITRMLEADSTHLHLGIALSYMRLYYNVQLSPRPSNCNDVHRQVRISRKPKTCSKTQLLTNSTSPLVKKSQRWLSKWLFSLAVVDLWGGGLSSVFTRGPIG
jgi:hypothetical protein